ncbi:MAG: cytochrome c oxidase subunit II [Halobacteriales archaeon]|nr:cytochrome c oxidase subunit II [Halobacteriales archaeon]
MPTEIAASVVGMLSSSAVAQVSTDGTSEIFTKLFSAFLIVGGLVGVVVIAYALQKAYRYRSDDGETRENKPEPGELPPLEGGGKGKKLFLSFGASAFIVITLVGWTYFAGFVPMEQAPPQEEIEDQMEITVTGFQFGWEYEYPNGETTTGTLRVPKDTVIRFEVTSDDVMHNFGIPEFDRRTDAIPGQTTDMWILPKETGTHQILCYELCGTGHSNMRGEIEVMSQEEFEQWYEGTGQ